MKIAHEHPLSISQVVESTTDYNYYISTIAAHIPEYLNYAKQDNRFKILDCGTFEEGKPMADEEYLNYIKMIKPHEFIVPDHLFDKEATLTAARRWLHLIEKEQVEGTPIGVVQGRTLLEQVSCYRELVVLFDKVAIPYDLPTDKLGEKYLMNVDTVLPACGRFELVKYLFENQLFCFNTKHHFLGIDLPTELLRYKQDLPKYAILKHIDSIDTSSPVLHGLKEIPYNKDYGLLVKNKQMMKELILEHNISSSKLDLIKDNITIFKQFCNY